MILALVEITISGILEIVAHHETNIRIPLPENEALRLLGKVKPTADMPRPGATKAGAKPKPAKKRR
jgi:hypothetical protein